VVSRTWTDLFSQRLHELVADRPDLVAVTAAMAGPTGLARIANQYPERVVDVGIAEQHAVASAAGLALGGQHPVVALYATFANRAFDQTLLDVGLHGLPVTFVLDRAGITGPDGPSHHGIWDLALFGLVPGMRVAAPRDGTTLSTLLTEAIAARTPTMVRFPKGSPGSAIPALGLWGTLDVLRRPPVPDVLVVAVGATARSVLAAAEYLSATGIECTVVDPRWVLPPSPQLAPLAQRHRLVVTVEDGVRDGGVGSRVRTLLSDEGVDLPVGAIGLPSVFVPHGSRDDLLARYGLDDDGIAASIASLLKRCPSRRRQTRFDGGSRRRPRFSVLRGGAPTSAALPASPTQNRGSRSGR
jgi:1-deoxy-D-xylulose-5-phosphate synthase